MLRTINIVIAVLFTTIVLCAVGSPAALAVSQWLIGGAQVVNLTSVTATGLFILNIEGIGPVRIHCETVFDGSVGPGGEDEVTEVLSAAGVLIPSGQNLGGADAGFLTVGTGLDCLTLNTSIGCGPVGSLAEVWPVNLPWLTHIELDAQVTFLDDFFGESEMEPAFDAICGNTGISFTCEGLMSTTLVNVGAGVSATFDPTVLVPCITGTGFYEGELIIATLNVGILSVSDV